MWVESSSARRAEARGGVAGAGRGGLVNTLPIHQELDVCGVLFGCFLLGFPPRPTCVSPGVTRSPFSHSPSLCLYSNSQSLLGWTYTRSRPERALVSLVPEFDIHSVDGIKQERVTRL